MGLPSQMIRLILNEHKYKPISGSVLLIGRQTVPLSPEGAIELVESEGVPTLPDVKIELDTKTRDYQGRLNCLHSRLISDAGLFALFCNAKVQALDVSNYEGADVICNLNDTVPDEMVEQFDLIYNGSCLDNIFDPAKSIKNLSRLLKPGGRIIHIEHGSAVNGPYLMYPPDWFHDYYAVNRFADCKIYVAYFKDYPNTEWDTYSWDPVISLMDNNKIDFHWGRISPLKLDSLILTVAEKGKASTWDRCPIQFGYRSKEDQAQIEEAAIQFAKSPRPKISSRSIDSELPKYKYTPPPQPKFIPFGSLARHPFGSLPWIKKLVKKSVRTVLRMPPPPLPPGEVDVAPVVQNGIPPSFRFCRTLK
jgi:SAM-dependent methyltransferase